MYGNDMGSHGVMQLGMQCQSVWLSGFFFWHFVGDGASAASRSSSPTDEGDCEDET